MDDHKVTISLNLPVSYQAQMRAPFGVLGIHCADEALTGITFLSSSSAILSPDDAFTQEVCAQLAAYFLDADFRFNLPLKLSGTTHQMKVWQAMSDIPRGKVQTYGNIALSLHSSARAVGQACGANPIPIVVPCHRVVSKLGLGGFMHREDNDALDMKRWLLVHEGVEVA